MINVLEFSADALYSVQLTSVWLHVFALFFHLHQLNADSKVALDPHNHSILTIYWYLAPITVTTLAAGEDISEANLTPEKPARTPDH